MPNRCARRREADIAVPTFAGAWMARESHLQNGRQFPFRLHDREQAFRNLFRAPHAGCGALRFGDPLGNVVARRVIQLVIPAPKRAILTRNAAENALELIGDGYGPFFAVEFNPKTGDAAFDGVALPFASAC